jgi:hypothetical protein
MCARLQDLLDPVLQLAGRSARLKFDIRLQAHWLHSVSCFGGEASCHGRSRRPTRSPAFLCSGSFVSAPHPISSSPRFFFPPLQDLVIVTAPSFLRAFRVIDVPGGCQFIFHLSCCVFFLHLLWPYTSPNKHHRAAVSCILSPHVPSHVRLHASPGSVPSTSTSTTTHHELQYPIGRLPYAPQGPYEVLHRCRRPQDRHFTRGTGSGGRRLRPAPLPLCSAPRIRHIIDREPAGHQASSWSSARQPQSAPAAERLRRV